MLTLTDQSISIYYTYSNLSTQTPKQLLWQTIIRDSVSANSTNLHVKYTLSLSLSPIDHCRNSSANPSIIHKSRTNSAARRYRLFFRSCCSKLPRAQTRDASALTTSASRPRRTTTRNLARAYNGARGRAPRLARGSCSSRVRGEVGGQLARETCIIATDLSYSFTAESRLRLNG